MRVHFPPGGYAIELYRRRRIWTVSARDRNTFINKENSPSRSLRCLERGLDTRAADRKREKWSEREREREKVHVVGGGYRVGSEGREVGDTMCRENSAGSF